MDTALYCISGVIITWLIASLIRYSYRLYLNSKIKSALQAKMIEEYNSSIVEVKCPCFKHNINIPFHPQATPEFRCPKCNDTCGYQIDFKTFKK